MTETERRRIALLQETRKIYSERLHPPAVHPRYQSVYKSIYKNDEVPQEEQHTSSFGARVVIAVLLFGLFMLASRNEMAETKSVVNEIRGEFRGIDLDGFIDFQIFH